MASPNARMALTGRPTYHVLAPDHREPWLDHMVALGIMANRPIEGEMFKSEEHCSERINAWDFKKGFRFVIGKSRGKHATPNWEFWCMYHSEKSQNNRKLKDRVEWEEDGNITTDRKRDTVNRRLECQAAYRLSYRYPSRGSEKRKYIGEWIHTPHDYRPAPKIRSPLAFIATKPVPFRS